MNLSSQLLHEKSTRSIQEKYIKIRNVNITEQHDMVCDFQILVNSFATKYNG